MLPDWALYLGLYTLVVAFIVSTIVFFAALVYEIGKGPKKEPLRRRATDVKRGAPQ